MTLFRLTPNQQSEFHNYPETFQGAHFAFLTHGEIQSYCVVIGGLVVVVIDKTLQQELDFFMQSVWRSTTPFTQTIIQRYIDWLDTLPPPVDVYPIDAPRAAVYAILTGLTPPPPPNRPTVVPAAPHGRGALPATYGHLPFFHAVTEDHEVFYRWEPWPTSLRVDQSMKTIAPWTFASPSSEVAFVPTGFSAVARMALPSFFPAVFRWEIQPTPGTSILCGAVVPMWGQSGGGVEVCFDLGASNRGPIANQIIIQPL